MEATAGTSFSLDDDAPASDQRASDAEQESDTDDHKRPTPPKPAPRPTKAEIRRDEQERKYDKTADRAASHRQKPPAQGKPQAGTYASTGGEHGDE